MSKHDAWKDEAIAMKLAGAPIDAIAAKFGVKRNTINYVTKGVRSTNIPVRTKGPAGPFSTRYQGSAGFSMGCKKRHAVQFLPELFDEINSFAQARDISFSSAVTELAAIALSDIRSAA